MCCITEEGVHVRHLHDANRRPCSPLSTLVPPGPFQRCPPCNLHDRRCQTQIPKQNFFFNTNDFTVACAHLHACTLILCFQLTCTICMLYHAAKSSMHNMLHQSLVQRVLPTFSGRALFWHQTFCTEGAKCLVQLAHPGLSPGSTTRTNVCTTFIKLLVQPAHPGLSPGSATNTSLHKVHGQCRASSGDKRLVWALHHPGH